MAFHTWIVRRWLDASILASEPLAHVACQRLLAWLFLGCGKADSQ